MGVGLPSAPSTPMRNLTGITWHVDVHVVDGADALDLRRTGELGWVNVKVTDTGITR